MNAGREGAGKWLVQMQQDRAKGDVTSVAAAKQVLLVHGVLCTVAGEHNACMRPSNMCLEDTQDGMHKHNCTMLPTPSTGMFKGQLSAETARPM